MAHYDQETLALLAMADRGVTTDDSAHLTVCVRCRRDVDQLAALIATIRQVSVHDRPQAPPEAVWQRVVAGITDLAEHAQRDPMGVEPTLLAPPIRSGPVVGSVSDPRQTRRPRRRLQPAVLAAAAALIGILIGAGSMYEIVEGHQTRSAVAAQIVLQPLDVPAAHGTAILDHLSGAQRTLTVHVQGLPTVPGTYYEVWLMNATPRRLLSLGVLDSTEAGQYQIPAGLELSSYPVVDISLQPFNGNPAHSGASAARGTLHS